MSDQPDNIVLVLLRRIDERTADMQADIRNLQVRMSALETGLAELNGRVDRIAVDVDRIKRRLDLTESAH